MFKFQKIVVFLALLLIAVYPGLPVAAQSEPAAGNTPIILETAKIQSGLQTSVQIKGLVSPGNDVLVYLDGIFVGLANISQGNADYSKFYYSSPAKTQNINDVLLISRNKTTKTLSAPVQNKITTIIERSFTAPASSQQISTPTKLSIPAPILKTPLGPSCFEQPYISGFSKNQTTVKIYIDEVLYISLPATSKVADTAFFSYTPTTPMHRGNHQIYALAQDAQGNVSPKSNIISFCATDPQTISTTSSSDVLTENSSTSTAEVKATSSVFQKTNNKADINGSKTAAPGNKINLFLFGLFVLIIIIWIIFVNRELIEENKDSVTKIK